MAAFSFVHCADVHLGAPVRGLGQMPRSLRDKLRDAPFEALSRLVSAAIANEVAAVIIAGDLFDAADCNLRAHVFLRSELERLDDAGIRTYVAAGNHDPLGGLARGVDLPESVHLFGPDLESVALRRDGVELARVYGVSFPKSAVYRNLAADFPRRPTGDFNIAVLHTNVGDRPGFAPYAPCRISDLTATGFDYWALGHVHTRETLSPRAPVVHYPGNPQGLHTGEPGARGATLVKVSDSGKVELEPIWTDVVRWHRARTSIEGLEASEELVGAFSDLAGALRGAAPNRVHLVRWTLNGHGPLHGELNRPGAEEDLCKALRAAEGIRAEGDTVWLERIELATNPARDMDRLREQQDWLGDMLRLAADVATHPPRPPRGSVGDARPADVDDDVVRAMRDALADLLDVPRLTRALGSDPWVDLRWKELVARAEALAVEHLAPSEAD